MQLEILASAAKALKSGGVLVYSTCTIEASENKQVVTEFLAQHKEFSLDFTGKYLPGELGKKWAAEKMIQLYPQRDGIDGFFIARMQKNQ